MVAANKCDLEEERQVATEVGQEFAELSNAFYIETRLVLEAEYPRLFCFVTEQDPEVNAHTITLPW